MYDFGNSHIRISLCLTLTSFTGQRQDFDHYGQGRGGGGYRRGGRGGGGYNDGFQQGRYQDRGFGGGGGGGNRNFGGGQDYGYNRNYGGGSSSGRNRDYGRDRYPQEEFKESPPGESPCP